MAYYVCNPATRKSASLPQPPPRSESCSVEVVAFYRHNQSGEHRVLWVSISLAGSLDDDVPAAADPADYFILTVGSKHPRRIEWPTDPDPTFCPPVHHRGSVHWAMDLAITAFDTEAETFRQMSRPAQLGDEDVVSLMEVAGELALWRTTADSAILDVWVMQDYDAGTWGFQYRIDVLAMEASPPLSLGDWNYEPRMAVINDRELLVWLLNNGRRLLHCDIDGTFLGNVEGNRLTLTNLRLQESLISIPLFERGVEKEPSFVMVL